MRVFVLFLLSVLIVFFLRDKRPYGSEVFQREVVQYLKQVGDMTDRCAGGINHEEFETRLDEIVKSHEWMKPLWPDGIIEERVKMQEVVAAYLTASILWKRKVAGELEPIEPDIGGYRNFIEDTKRHLIVRVYEGNQVSYRGRKYIPFDENIQNQMAIAKRSFTEARVIILERLR
jgi:hypothetical protein